LVLAGRQRESFAAGMATKILSHPTRRDAGFSPLNPGVVAGRLPTGSKHIFLALVEIYAIWALISQRQLRKSSSIWDWSCQPIYA